MKPIRLVTNEPRRLRFSDPLSQNRRDIHVLKSLSKHCGVAKQCELEMFEKMNVTTQE
jgi:hypothetical protein